MKKIEKFIKCNNFSVAVVGTGKNPTLYFIDKDVYYPEDDFDSKELPFKAGVNAKYIDEWLLQMSMNDFNKIMNNLKNLAKRLK